MIVSYISCHEVSDDCTGMSFQHWKNKWKLSGNNGGTVSWTRRIIISGHQSSKMKTVSSSLLAVPEMTWHRLLVQERYEPWPGTKKRLLSALLKCQRRQGTFPLQRARVTSYVWVWSHIWEDGLCFMSPKYLGLRRPSNPDLEDSQEYEPNMENLHIQKPTTFSLYMASQQSEVVCTGPFHEWQCCS